jgi:hypothetical protein
MRIEIPIFGQVQADLRGLPPRAFQVWCGAIKHLDLVQWRELSLSGLAVEMDADTSTVTRAFGVLVDRGYICKRERAGLSALYRVPLSRGFDADPVEWPADDVPPPAPQTQKSQSLGPRVVGRSVV